MFRGTNLITHHPIRLKLPILCGSINVLAMNALSQTEDSNSDDVASYSVSPSLIVSRSASRASHTFKLFPKPSF